MSPEEPYASALLHWPASISELTERQAVARRALARVEAGQLIGIGSGAEAYLLLRGIGQLRAERGLTVGVVCSSYETETTALNLGLRVDQLGSVEPDWALDAADEVDPAGRLLQGHGADPLKAKLLWASTQHMLLADDPASAVEALGADFPLPVEVHRDAVIPAARELARLGASDVVLRLATGKDGPVFTGSGNLLLDARFSELASGLDAEIRAVPGVVATGLFENYRFERV